MPHWNEVCTQAVKEPLYPVARMIKRERRMPAQDFEGRQVEAGDVMDNEITVRGLIQEIKTDDLEDLSSSTVSGLEYAAISHM
jgi:hypothetical protein